MARYTEHVDSIATGAKRAIAFGGGGEWFLAWMLGYATGLAQEGVDLAQADVTLGTSAGSIVGAAIKGGKLIEVSETLRKLGADPDQANKLLSISVGAQSQVRAQSVMGATTEITKDSLNQIGRAAMAAHNSPVDKYILSLNAILGLDSWPIGHHTTATDCYTGQSLIVSEANGIPISVAAAASSSLPGVNGPTWLGDQFCMDGGVSDSSTHGLALTGAKFVLIIGMFDFEAHPPEHVNPAFGIAERIAPGTAQREARELRAQGSTVHVTIAGPDPSTNFMDPATIIPAITLGISAGKTDAAVLGPLWNVE